MESLLICGGCRSRFDLGKKSAKILPCFCTLCLSCLEENKNESSEYVIKCNSCKKSHHLSNLNAILTSKIIDHFLEKSKQSTNSINNENQMLKSFSESLAQRINTQICETSKHYESTLNDIENRAEKLIERIHQSREILQDQINQHRNDALLYANGISKSKNLEISNLETELNNILGKNIIEKKDIDRIKFISDKVQSKIYDIKQLLWYFADNQTEMKEGLLGNLLCKKTEKSFMRIKNLKFLLSENSSALKVKILSEFKLTPLRHEVLPLSKDRIVKIYFTTQRSLHFELFDTSTGKCLKSLNAFENLSSFPISYGYGDHFCVCFTSKNTEEYYFDMNTNFIRLYDIEFNLIKSVQRFTSIESIYMNDKYVMLYYSHKVDGCCEVYDYQMNEQFTFGQTNPGAPFFMEKSNLSMKQQMNLNFKLNPRIFGLTGELIYMWNYNKVFIISRKSGDLVRSLNLHGARPYFLLDNQGNIVCVNSQAKKITLYSQDLEMIIENIYSDNLDSVHINKQDQMAFVDMEKKSVVYI